MTPGFDTPTAVSDAIEIDFSHLSLGGLEAMNDAADDVQDCLRKLTAKGRTITSEVLRGQGEFVEWDHYPAGDVYDWDSHSQYYYHTHPAGNQPPGFTKEFWAAEHGHFHTFLRAQGMPDGTLPSGLPSDDEDMPPEDDLSHIIAISMDRNGLPFRLFTTNRWVTNEQWYDAETVIDLIDHFEMGCAYPSRPVNTWITGMLHLFRPQIEVLLRRRDAALADLMAQNAGAEVNAFDDRSLEITSVTEISITDQIDRLTGELNRRRNAVL